MKKFKSVFLCLMLALVMVVPVLLTGCGAPSNMDMAKIYARSAQAYYNTHTDYTNYSDTTYSFTNKTVYTGTTSVNEKEYEITGETVSNVSMYFKNLDEETLGFYLINTINYKETDWEVDAETGKPQKVTYTGVDSYEYMLTKKTIDETDTYYWTYVTKYDIGTENEEVIQKYNIFSNRATYVDFMNYLIDQSKNMVLKTTFYPDMADGDMSEYVMATLLNYTQNGNNVKMSMNLTMPYVNYEKNDEHEEFFTGCYSVTNEATVSKNGPLTYKTTIVELFENGRYDITSTLTVSNGAQGVYEVPEFDENWTIADAEFNEDYFHVGGML